MTQLGEILDTAALEAQIAAGLITRRVLAGSDITVYNYTARAAFGGAWSTETRRCRGLVADGAGQVLARPFAKFFDLGRTAVPFGGPMVASEKFDGSLGILYLRPDGAFAITTRGDPNSWQAEAATRLWRERYAGLEPPEGETWCFEIILPENRVVVDYGERRDLVALASIDISTGRDLGLPAGFPGPVAGRFDVTGGKLGMRLAEMERLGDKEGLVVYWPEADVRAKVKLVEYVQRHRLIFATSTKTIWDALAAGQDPVANVANGPAELRRFVEAHANALRERHDAAVAAARDVVARLSPAERAERRFAALAIKDSAQPGLAFLALDGRNDELDAAAWRVVRPARAEAFRVEGAGE